MKRLVIFLVVIVCVLGGTALVPALSSGGEHTVPPVTKVGFVGDSITAGEHGDRNAVQNEIAALGKGYQAVNRGMNGATTVDWLPGKTYLDSALEVFRSEGVKIVSVALGVNDASRLKLAPEDYAANMRAIADALLKDTEIHLVVLNYPTYVQRDNRPQIAQDLEEYMKALDEAVNGTTVVTGDTQAYGYFKTHTDQLADGVHPSEQGYKALGELWARGLLGALATSRV